MSYNTTVTSRRPSLQSAARPRSTQTRQFSGQRGTGRRPATALTAVDQMNAHRRAGGISILGGDGVEDAFMFGLHPAQKGQMVGIDRRGVEPPASRNHRRPQCGHQLRKMRVLGGPG